MWSSCFNDNAPSMLPTPTSASTSTDTLTLSTISWSEEEVFHLLSTYKTRTASGPDGISSIMLRNTATFIFSKLTFLFNLSLRSGKFLMLKRCLTLFPTPLSSNLCHLLASQNPYFPGLRTTLPVGSRGLSWMGLIHAFSSHIRSSTGFNTRHMTCMENTYTQCNQSCQIPDWSSPS